MLALAQTKQTYLHVIPHRYAPFFHAWIKHLFCKTVNYSSFSKNLGECAGWMETYGQPADIRLIQALGFVWRFGNVVSKNGFLLRPLNLTQWHFTLTSNTICMHIHIISCSTPCDKYEQHVLSRFICRCELLWEQRLW